jgi:hypothetical protein
MKRAFVASLCAALAAVGCQLINDFDDVKQPVEEAGAGTGGSGGSGATGDASGGNAGSGGSSATGGTGGDVATGGSSSGGSAGAAGADSGPTREGLIVIAGRDASKPAPNSILITLDPATGSELWREATPQPIRGVGYDAQRDLWFLFQRGSSGDPIDPHTLRVGTFNLQSGAWQEAGSASVPAPEGPGVIGVLRDRILYKSTVPPSGTQTQPQTGLTLLDTTTPTAVVVRGAAQSPLPAAGARGVIARPATAAAGGTVTLVQTLSPCYDFPNWDGGTPPKLCDVQLENMLVAATSNTSSSQVTRVVGNLPQVGSSPGWTSSPSNLVIVLPADAYQVDPTGQVLRLAPNNLTEAQPSISFAAGGPFISAATYDRCLEVVIASELLTAQSIFVIPTTAGGTVHKEPVSSSAQRVAFEPYTRTVIRPFVDNSNPELTAYVLGGTKIAPTLAQRPQPNLPWAPPAALIPDIVMTRDPGTAACPAP